MEDLCSMFEHDCADAQEFNHDYDDGFVMDHQSLGLSLGLAELIAEEEKDNYNIIDEEIIAIEHGKSVIERLDGLSCNMPEFEQYVNSVCGI